MLNGWFTQETWYFWVSDFTIFSYTKQQNQNLVVGAQISFPNEHATNQSYKQIATNKQKFI